MRRCWSSPAELEASILFKLSMSLFYCDFMLGVHLFASEIICVESWVMADLNKDWYKAEMRAKQT